MNGPSGAVRDTLTGFVDVLYDTLDEDGHHLERVLNGDETLVRDDLDSEPEDWTEDALINPLLDAVDLHKQPGRPNPRFETPDWVTVEIPDFELIEENDTEVRIIGENKSVNNVEEAKEDIQNYISKRWWPHYGIATDGIEWVVQRVEESSAEDNGEDGTTESYRSFSEHVDLRPALQGIAADQGYIGGSSTTESDIDATIESFVDVFAPDALVELLEQTAPKQLRDQRKRDVEAFYELYIELLFGESNEYDYDTCLRDDILDPEEASDKDCDVFAVTLVNRLLFIKFLENRGVMDEGFLTERVEAYNEGLPKTLYKSVFEPLFYELLNTPMDGPDSRPDHQTREWKGDVPYLNGGLFRENVENEREYDVVNRTLPEVIDDLVEGHELDVELDPAILGSVFEKTINHISEEEDRQKQTGAYYTPDDVTTIVNERAVRPKAREELVDAYASTVVREEEFRDDVQDMELDEILTKIEDSASWFGRSDGTEEALNRIRNLTVLDPACGSGHFLTVALDELHRIQLSLLRGQLGDSLDDRARYEAKKELALTTIYGVDVEPVGVEIAKLRIWLKIIEEEWTRDFGRLPNIDVNIATGNSLIGFPIKGEVTGSLTLPDIQDRVQELVQRRIEYRDSNEGDKQEIETLLEEKIRPGLNEAFIEHLNYTVETKIEELAEFDAVMERVSENYLYPTIDDVQVRRADGDSFTDDERERFNELGYRVYQSSARISIEDRESDIRANGGTDLKEQITTELREVLDDGYVFSEFNRQPLSVDYDDMLGEPFHWPVEFPEVMLNGEDVLDEDLEELDMNDMKFDLILGNPPYGDITTESEEALTATYRMAGTDIAAPFVERQLQLLAATGYFGNVTTLKLAYKAEMEEMQDVLRENLQITQMACFAKRPSKVFEGVEVRIAIITGSEENENTGTIETSEFIRFDNDKDRDRRFQDIEYRPIEGLILRRNGVNGDGRHIAIPKVGLRPIERVLETLRDHDTIIKNREQENETDHAIWRRRGMDYFTNPMLEKLYDGTDIKALHFETELEARAAFLTVSSSVFYVYWCAYGDMFHLNLSEIRAFPLPEMDELESRREAIMEISDRLWETMEAGFNAELEQFDNYPTQKPIIDEADAVLGELYGLRDEDIEFVQSYHSNYGRHGPENRQLPSE